jgi:hypothetical protein
MRQLHEALREGHPWVHGKQLLRNTDARTGRVRDLFKRKAVWELLIESDGRGCYRLKDPNSAIGPHRQRLYRRFGPSGQALVIQLSRERALRQGGARRRF